MDYGAVTLLKLSPHGNKPDSLVQGTLISAPRKDAPSFLYVLNATLKNYRRNSLILVDGQSLLVPEALDIFLRRVRDTENEKLLFIWKICWNRDEADVPGDRRASALADYFTAAESLISMSAGTIDMYEVLTEAAEEAVHKVEEASDEYDWLLDLLDEAQVKELPATEHSREEKYVLVFQSPYYRLNGDRRAKLIDLYRKLKVADGDKKAAPSLQRSAEEIVDSIISTQIFES